MVADEAGEGRGRGAADQAVRREERLLVERVLGGDREAFRLVVLRYQRLLAELIFRHTGDRTGTEDLVQETFLRAYRRLDAFDPRYRLSTWLVQIGLNVARDQGRRKKVRDDGLERVAARPERRIATPAEEAVQSELRAEVGRALAGLPEPQREVIVLSVYGGYSQSEIAEILGLPLGTVKSRQRTALEKLRPLVAPLHPGGPQLGGAA